jgi:transcriptional regulator with XRE-family HTH domain
MLLNFVAMGIKSQWADANVMLKRLWDERVAPTGMSQEDFGEKYGIGSQAMVSQYLLGTRPLNYDAAARFAKGFGCTIEDICPAMATTLAQEIVPVLGRRLWRSRLRSLALACLIPSLFTSPTPSHASVFSHGGVAVYYVKWRRWFWWLFPPIPQPCEIL